MNTLTAYNFAMLRTEDDTHGQIFNTFKKLRLKDFTKHKLIFVALADHILIRTAHHVDGIPMKTEEIKIGNTVQGAVLTASLVEKSLQTEDGLWAKQYVDLLGDPKWLHEHITALFERAGLADIEYKYSVQDSILVVQKRNRTRLPVIEIAFTARVADFEKLQFAWLNGIGRKKTYGLGMLRIASV